MEQYVFFTLITIALSQYFPYTHQSLIRRENEVRNYLLQADELYGRFLHNSVIAEWNYASNLTEYNKGLKIEASLKLSECHREIARNISKFPWKQFRDPLLYRLCKKLALLGDAALPEKDLTKLKTIISDMEGIYSKGKVCKKTEVKPNCSLSLEPDITRIMTKSRDYSELLRIWKEWHDTVGIPLRPLFLQYISLNNKAARRNGFSDAGALWRDEFESSTFEEDIEKLFLQVLPLYEQLHAYVRRKLIHIYGADKIDPSGGIPAHLLGNMWAQIWSELYLDTRPFPNKEKVDITSSMKKQNFSAKKMFKTAENFFTSLGLPKMTPSFWNNSILEKPKDGRELICHASAWDFYDGKDYRIKMCADITSDDLLTIHHEMGHVEYFMHYSKLPVVFRDGANSGFHEAIGDTITLSVETPKHLHKINLLKDATDDEEISLNFLYQLALDKVAFLPFGYLIDQWRWLVFSGKIKKNELNKSWWNLRYKYQGIVSPVKRNEKSVDAAAKYHVAANVPYVRYFVSFIIQFQFHKALCNAAGHTGPLYKCDIYGSKQAGKLLSDMLEMGASQSWFDAMEKITGQRKMDAGPLLEFFHPLMTWFKKQNQNEAIGWKYDWSSIKEKFGIKRENQRRSYSLKKSLFHGPYNHQNTLRHPHSFSF